MRIARDSIRLSGISKSIAVLTDELEWIAPNSASKLDGLEPIQVRGYGYWRYKSELVKRALDGYWGNFDGVLWIDAGCEINSNFFSNFYFMRMTRHAKKQGAMFYRLTTPEEFFTKKKVLDYFSSRVKRANTTQIQATWFMLSGPVGYSIAEEWAFLAESRPDFFDDTTSEEGELPFFIEHRHDQSVFSLICKSHEIQEFAYTPTSGPKSFKSAIRSLVHPIWNTRNLSGTSMKSSWFEVLCAPFFYLIKRRS